jgi:hypothetical protein
MGHNAPRLGDEGRFHAFIVLALPRTREINHDLRYTRKRLDGEAFVQEPTEDVDDGELSRSAL